MVPKHFFETPKFHDSSEVVFKGKINNISPLALAPNFFHNFLETYRIGHTDEPCE